MIKVGFVINFRDQGWIGGLTYYKNLLNAISSLPDRKIEPVIFTGHTSDIKILHELLHIQIIKNHIFDLINLCTITRFIFKKIFHRDILFEYLLKKNKISVYSHYLFTGGIHVAPRNVPTIGWIPDFQHKYLPDLFSNEELIAREKSYHQICAESTLVIFSSNAAKKDAEIFYPEYRKKYRVLHFVTGNINFEGLPDINVIKEKYQIRGPYFIVPNQFWVHKNHTVILESLKILKSQGHSIIVVTTGSTFDHRQPNYFGSIQNMILNYNLAENFIVLGIIPYEHLLQLMINSIGFINPSRFEGWSTSVEEAKTLDHKILLSDIPVHREQNPKNGHFFSPDDPRKLADLLLTISIEHNPETSSLKKLRIFEDWNMQMIEFAQNYEKIVLDAQKEFEIRRNTPIHKMNLN